MQTRGALQPFVIITGAGVASAVFFLNGPRWLLVGGIFFAGAPFVWAQLKKEFEELQGYYIGLGAARFWVILLATVGFIVSLATADIWVSEQIGWPAEYGFHCRGRGCLLTDMYHSPKLLEKGGRFELAKFVLIWFIPAAGAAAVAGICLWRAIRKRKL